MELINKDDPVTLAKYAVERGLIDKNRWKWGEIYIRNIQMLYRIYCNLQQSFNLV